MRPRVPQPPIQPAVRPTEHHRFGPAAVAVGLGLVLAGAGVFRPTQVPLADGGEASELQLTKAFAFSGLQYADRLAAPEPPRLDNPATAAEELERWAQQQASATAPDWKVRVDPRATTRCPT
jgi:hypothetical protein